MFKGIFRKKNIKMNLPSIYRSTIWLLLLTIFFVLGLGMLIFSTYLYFQINTGQVFVVDSSEGKNTSFNKVDKEKLIEVINIFENKSEEFERLKKIKNINIVDPSL